MVTPSDKQAILPGVWNDTMIHDWASRHLSPYEPSMVQSGSLDLRLSGMIRAANPWWIENAWMYESPENWGSYSDYVNATEFALEMRPRWLEPEPFTKYVLMPGEMVLLSSLEVMELLPCMTAMLVLKSTPGRNGLNHSHSGHGDPGFGHGNPSSWTFEVKNISHAPYILEAGASIIQMVISSMAAIPAVSYADKPQNYNGQLLPTVARR